MLDTYFVLIQFLMEVSSTLYCVSKSALFALEKVIVICRYKPSNDMGLLGECIGLTSLKCIVFVYCIVSSQHCIATVEALNCISYPGCRSDTYTLNVQVIASQIGFVRPILSLKCIAFVHCIVSTLYRNGRGFEQQIVQIANRADFRTDAHTLNIQMITNQSWVNSVPLF